ncbi:MAG: nucleotide pyrophosphohydrolase [Archaeoglobus sp.]|uniref:MazG nucleotide pyrophosphohydrolase domain-containing protein n=1 Tax=Archaeoglobus sp. TaxID=1872626 RepID=UPI001D95911B|nr:MazG nucleotide pyrophosphohydrolase domain-containing protein [Archaeoglobus sp.]MBO8180709.1 nucleotide pyrophosphohydrolase [Archaeoglobus sp.]
MKISEFQKMISEIYINRDRERGVEKTMLWVVEEVGELAEAVRKGTNVGEEIADVMAWLVSLANLLDVDVEKEVLKKYPGYCIRCGKKPCECDSK